MANQDAPFQPKNAVTPAIEASLSTGAVGLAAAAVQNALAKRNVGTWGVFTRSGGIIAMFAAVGGVYQFSAIASANLREKNDSINPAIGAFLGGSIMGLRSRSLPAVIGFGAASAVVVAAYDYTGGTLSGYTRNPEVDEYERKEELRKNRRRPIQQTIDELGEGRGIYPPGYEQRRAERIKKNYGIDVPSQS